MYYQKIIMNALKYIKALRASTYPVKNVYPLNLRRREFITFLPQIKKINRSYNTNHSINSTRNTIFIASGSFLFNLFKPKEEKDDIGELKMTIKRSILLIQKKEFLKAEQMLHIALRQAQTLQHYDGITYIYDVMANLAYEINDLQKAEQLFKSVLKRLVAKGVATDDLAFIHVSLKMADIYDKMGDTIKANSGYKFCLEHLKEHLAKDNENQDVLQLLGLSLEKYASMLFMQSNYNDALKYFVQAYEISIKINGEENEQTAVLLNDLGSVNYMLGKYDQAVEYLSKAAELGKKLPEMVDLGSIYINLGNIFITQGLYEEAKQNCTQGGNLAKNKGDNDSTIEAKNCLKKIESLLN